MRRERAAGAVRTARRLLGILGGLGLVLAFDVAPAQAQPASICARVKIEIQQRLTFERVAFDARLVVTNNLTDQPLDGFGVTLNITTLDGRDANDLFFVKVNSLENISGIDGSGSVAPGVRAEAHWLIIPSAGAGGEIETGQTYLVSGAVNFHVASGPRDLALFPAPIIVRPQPLLDVDYFLPPVVDADDPFTEAVEAPVPFPLGVRVSNHGFGTAGNLHITSGQPKIVENKQGLLIAFRLLGTTVNGQPVQPTLNATFGTIPPQGCGVADWQMITTLSGKFIAFDAEYTHAPDLGGELTSLIRSSSANVLVREMLVDLPGRDNIKDFLADTDHDDEHVPDRIFESSCGDFPVSPTAGSTTGNPSAANPEVPLTTDVLPFWAFTRVPDPAGGLIPLAEVVRSDGKRLRPENFWISRVPDKIIKSTSHYFVNVIDYNSTGSYTLRYQRPAADTVAPVTAIVFQEPSFGTNPTFITPDTQIIFTASDDISGVGSIEYRLDSGPFQPAFPFSIAAPGPHLLTFRSTDRAGNREADRSVSVVVDPDPPVLAALLPSPAAFTPSAPAGAPAARETVVPLSASDAMPDLTGLLEIARGTGDFASLPLVRSIPFSLHSGVTRDVVWDGRNGIGVVVPEGTYTLRVTVGEALGHRSQATATVRVTEFLAQEPVAATSGADQQLPDLRGDLLVWQDNREGNWDIVMLTLGSPAAVNLTAGQAADQTHPATDGRYIVWQDRRNGNWDIFLYDTASGTTRPLTGEVADQENPAVAAPWVVWQEKRGGQYDIVARNLDTSETVEVSAGDTGAHDQVRPSISGSRVAYEDYRFGLGEIFVYDLAARTERRITNNIDNQTQPSIDGDTVVWVDERNANRDLYMFDLVSGVERRLTYTPTDESQPSLRSGRVAYVDYAAGLGDPGIALYSLASRRSLRITADPNRQEEPVTDADRVAWQDDRTGRWQIRMSDVALAAVPLARDLGPGLNLIGLSDAEVAAHPTAFALLTAWNGAAGVNEIQRFEPATGRMLGARIPAGGGTPEGTDFALQAGDALIARAPAGATLALAPPTSCTGIGLAAGANYVSLPCVPPGYTAKDLVEALGISKVTSISRYDSFDGR
ncbi:MAG TPA: hypothetical protein VFT43_05700, partial [Candidatus Polarisedimenticolia bacterium]|nr:hypothetical protein [Candidatus Polarisedimenticolia bacterium]